ncbi:MAG: glycosyltransferase family 39 protein [bacterium]
MRNRNWFLLILAALLLTRLSLFWEDLLQVDEALFGVFTRAWHHGAVPYRELVETKAMGTYYFYTLASWLAGALPDVSLRAVRILSLAWTLFTALCLQATGRRLFSREAGWVAALFYIIFSADYVPNIVAVNIEVILLLPWTLSIFLLARPASELRWFHSFLSGVCFSLAFICKYQSGILLPVVFIYYGVLLFREKEGWGIKKAVLHSFCFALGVLPVPSLMLWQLNRLGSLQDFFYWNFEGSLAYIRFGNASIRLGQKLLTRALPYLAATGLLWVLVAIRGVQAWKEKKTESKRLSAQELLLWTWFFLSFVPVAVGKRFYDHYFLLLIPSASLLAAASLTRDGKAWWKKGRGAVACAFLIPALGFSAARFAIHPLYAKVGVTDLTTYRSYGAYLRNNTKPQDRILVWGYAPAVYWYSERLPASRFLWSDLLSGRVPGIVQKGDAFQENQSFVDPKAWEMFFDDLKQHPPAYIMDMAPSGLHDYRNFSMLRFPRLMEWVNRDYEPQTPFQGAAVYRRRNGSL